MFEKTKINEKEARVGTLKIDPLVTPPAQMKTRVCLVLQVTYQLEGT